MVIVENAWTGAGKEVVQLCNDKMLSEAIDVYKKAPDAAGATALIAACGWKVEKVRGRVF